MGKSIVWRMISTYHPREEAYYSVLYRNRTPLKQELLGKVINWNEWSRFGPSKPGMTLEKFNKSLEAECKTLGAAFFKSRDDLEETPLSVEEWEGFAAV